MLDGQAVLMCLSGHSHSPDNSASKGMLGLAAQTHRAKMYRMSFFGSPNAHSQILRILEEESMWQMSDGLVPGKTLADEPKEVDIQVRTSRSVILSLYSRVSVTHLLVFPVFVAMHSAVTVSARISVGLKRKGWRWWANVLPRSTSSSWSLPQ